MTKFLIGLLIVCVIACCIWFALIGLQWWLPIAIIAGFIVGYIILVAFITLLIGGGE